MKLLVVLALVLNVSAFAAGDAAKGAKLYKKCVSCHGKDGMGKKSQKAPMVAGQYDWYVENQIKLIKTGKRKSGNAKKMVAFVKNLSAQDIKDLAAYISAMRPVFKK